METQPIYNSKYNQWEYHVSYFFFLQFCSGKLIEKYKRLIFNFKVKYIKIDTWYLPVSTDCTIKTGIQHNLMWLKRDCCYL